MIFTLEITLVSYKTRNAMNCSWLFSVVPLQNVFFSQQNGVPPLSLAAFVTTEIL